jgi:hypothetical protein
MEIRPVGAELFYVVGRTDMSELTVTFRTIRPAVYHTCVGSATNGDAIAIFVRMLHPQTIQRILYDLHIRVYNTTSRREK